jgi:hypothetical protein
VGGDPPGLHYDLLCGGHRLGVQRLPKSPSLR